MSVEQATHTAPVAVRRRVTPFLPALLVLVGVGVAAAIIFCAAYQYRPAYFVDIGTPLDKPFVQNFNAREPYPRPDSFTGPDYRWSRGRSTIHLPGVGTQPLVVALTIAAAANPQPDLALFVNGHAVPDISLPDNGFHTLRFAVPQEWLPDGDLDIVIQTQTFAPPGDRRLLGVVTDSVRVTPQQAGFAPGVVPPLKEVAFLSLLVLLLTATVLVGGFAPLVAGLCGGAAIGLLTLGLVATREWLTVMPRGPASATAIGVCVALWVVIPLAPRLFRRCGVSMTRAESGALALVFLAQFVLLYGLILHPMFTFSDTGLHAHNLQRVMRGNLLFTEPLPNGQPVPYPPGYYVLLRPFAALTDGSDTALAKLITFVSALLQCSGVYLVFYLAGLLWRRGPNRAGLVAAALYAFLPFPFQIFSQGNHTNIYGAWVFLLYLCILAGTLTFWHGCVGVVPQAKKSRLRAVWPYIAPCVALFVVLTSHYGTFLFANAFMLCSIGLFALAGIKNLTPRTGRRPLGSRAFPRREGAQDSHSDPPSLGGKGLGVRFSLPLRLLLIYLCALIPALALYYSHFFDIMGNGGGTFAGSKRPSLERMLQNAFTDIRTYFGLVALAALVAFALWLWQTRGGLFHKSHLPAPDAAATRPVRLLLAALLLTSAAFIAATYGFGTDSRYQFYIAPALALAAAGVLAQIGRLHRAAWLVAFAVIAVQFYTTLVFWLDRLPYYWFWNT